MVPTFSNNPNDSITDKVYKIANIVQKLDTVADCFNQICNVAQDFQWSQFIPRNQIFQIRAKF